MSRERAKWICHRCVAKHNIVAEEGPAVLLPCSWCGIENWVRPVGHGGADIMNVTAPTVVPEVVMVEAAAVIAPEPEPEEPEMTEQEREIAELKKKIVMLEEGK